MVEQRNYRRIPFHTQANILTRDATFSCELVDLALRGALLQSTQEVPLKIGDQVEIRIVLADPALVLHFSTELVHQQKDLYGFLFVTADDETFTHLRRLLELNFGDAEQAQQEFVHWLHNETGTIQ